MCIRGLVTARCHLNPSQVGLHRAGAAATRAREDHAPGGLIQPAAAYSSKAAVDETAAVPATTVWPPQCRRWQPCDRERGAGRQSARATCQCSGAARPHAPVPVLRGARDARASAQGST